MDESQRNENEIKVDENGYVWIGGVKICRLAWGLVEFYDKDKRRSEVRGSSYVYVTPEKLHEVFTATRPMIMNAEKVT